MTRSRRHPATSAVRRLAPRECPLCGRLMLRFRRGSATRDRSRCPGCDSRQRHRLLWLWLERETDLLRRGGDVLHVAPELGIEARLRAAPGIRYLSGDLEAGRADRVLDLTALDLEDASFDVVLCNHVLEHVPDDRAALRELFRVLRPGGWAVLGVPVMGERTVDGRGDEGPAERQARFGQPDHVRQYGRDYEQRVAAAGFDVEPILYRDRIPARDRRRFGLGYDLEREYGVDFNALREPWEIWLARRP